MRYALARLLCRIFGHRLVCDGFVNTETGQEDIECTRCGKSWNIIYY